MRTKRLRTRSTVLMVTCGLTALSLGACSSGGSSSTSASPTSPSASTSASTSSVSANSTVSFDKTIQQQLNAVGCSAGPVDGDIGPATDAAIVAFQRASALTPSGELNAQTVDALKTAAGATKTVCTTAPTPSTTTTPVGATCTATAIAASMPYGSPKIISYQCADGYAAAASGPDHSGSYFLQAEGGKWIEVQGIPCIQGGFQPPPALVSYCNGV